MKAPDPSPRKTLTVLSSRFAVAKSGMPSLLKSAVITLLGIEPALTGEVGIVTKS